MQFSTIIKRCKQTIDKHEQANKVVRRVWVTVASDGSCFAYGDTKHGGRTFDDVEDLCSRIELETCNIPGVELSIVQFSVRKPNRDVGEVVHSMYDLKSLVRSGNKQEVDVCTSNAKITKPVVAKIGAVNIDKPVILAEEVDPSKRMHLSNDERVEEYLRQNPNVKLM